MQKVCLVALAIMALLATMAVAETVQYQIAASRDDTFTIDSWNAYDQPTAFFPSSNGDRRAFFRWQLDIPAGATITSATMKVQSNGTAGNSSPSTVRLQVLDQEDCAAFISNPHFWVVGLDYVDWELPGTWTAGSWHSSPDISSLLQAFINRPGYASGNYFGIRGIHAAGLYKRAYQFDNAAEDGAILEVQYTTQSTPPPQQIVEYRINLGVDDAASIVTESGNSYTTAFFPGNNADRRAFMRWSVRIPTGATVDEVYLKVCGSGAYSDQNPSTIRIQMLDYDNCANFASNPFDRPVTASYVDWELPGVVAAGQWYTSPDLTALLQEFLDRPGNSYANFMGLRGMHVSGGYKKIYQYDYGDNTKGPILEVRYSGGLAMLELLMADPESRLGQKIYCRSINVYEGDRMEAYLDSTLVFSKDGNIQPEEMFTVDYSNLTAGAHNITVRILTNGVERGSLTRSWTTLHNGIPHVGINIDNAICIDGVPFFPITPFLLRKDNVVADPINTAINCLLGAGWYAEHTVTTWTDYLNVGSTNGFYVAGPLRWAGAVGSPVMDSDMQSLVNYVTSTRNHPALLAWSWDDEPDLHANNAIGTRYLSELTHQHDTNHPTWVNLVGYGFTRGDSAMHQDRAKEYCYMYNEYLFGQKTMAADIVGFDYYPHEYSTKFSWVNLSDYLLAFDRLQQWNYHLMPAATFIQPCDEAGPNNPRLSGRPWSPPPNEAQVKNLVWLSVIHGAKIISWFHYFEWYHDPRPNLAAMQECAQWIQDLTLPILSAPENVTAFITCTVPAGYRVDAMAREHDDLLYIFAGEVRDWGVPVYIQPDPDDITTAYFNVPPGSFTARFDVSDLASGTVITVYGENRSITSQAGYFEDTFDVHDVHIYVISNEVPQEIAASYQVANSGSDTYWYDSAQMSASTSSFCPSTNTTRGSGFRWAVDIPAGSTILAAFVEVKSNGVNGGTAAASLTFELLDEDNCLSFAGNPPPQLRSVTPGVSATWAIPEGAWIDGTWYASCNVSNLVQSFIDRPNYLPGSHLGMRAQGTGPYRKIYQFDNAPSDGAVLKVLYTTP